MSLQHQDEARALLESREPMLRFIDQFLADSILTRCTFTRQRKLRPNWVSELAGIIENGKWATTSITLAHCEENGRAFLVDGYHRLSAIVQAGVPAPLVVTHEECRNMDDVGNLYARLDRGIPRNIADGLVAKDLPAHTQTSLTLLRFAVPAVAVINSGFRNEYNFNRKRSNDERFDSLLEWVDEIKAYDEAIAGSVKMLTSKLRHAPIMAVGLVLMRHQREKATEFFRGVSASTSLVPETPQHTFMFKIIKSTRSVKGISGIARVSRWTANCWNSYYKGRSLKQIQSVDIHKAIIMLGTPYTEWQSDKPQKTTPSLST